MHASCYLPFMNCVEQLSLMCRSDRFHGRLTPRHLFRAPILSIMVIPPIRRQYRDCNCADGEQKHSLGNVAWFCLQLSPTYRYNIPRLAQFPPCSRTSCMINIGPSDPSFSWRLVSASSTLPQLTHFPLDIGPISFKIVGS